MASKSPRINAVVIGVGVVGLTTATFLQDALPEAQVTIVAEKFFEETTSHVAAGIFRVGSSFRGPTLELTKKWLTDSYKYYDDMLINYPTEAREAGITRISGYIFYSQMPNSEQTFLSNIYDECRPCTPTELKMLNQEFKSGIFLATILTECRKYLPYLMKRFQNKGGLVIKKKINSLEELCDDYDIVFNCSGLGSRYLCGDLEISPIRGQVYKVEAPWLQNFYYVDYDTYIIPGASGTVTLGGTKQFDSFNETVDKYDSASIWERCTSLLPSLKHAKIVGEYAGLRPHRSQVRVQKEVLSFASGKSITVIHNNGHGGYGVLSSPGTSMYAVALGTEFVLSSLKAKL